MKKIIAYILLLLPAALFSQSDSASFPHAFLIDAGYGASAWTGQTVDNGTHTLLTGSIGYRWKLNERLSLSAGISFLHVFRYATNDSMYIYNNAPVDPQNVYYAVDARTSIAQFPVKLTYWILQKGKMNLGVQMGFCLVNRLQHDIILTEQDGASASPHQDYWAPLSINTGTLRNISLELPFTYSLCRNTDLLLTPFSFYERPRDNHYGNFLAFGLRAGIAVKFGKLAQVKK